MSVSLSTNRRLDIHIQISDAVNRWLVSDDLNTNLSDKIKVDVKPVLVKINSPTKDWEYYVHSDMSTSDIVDTVIRDLSEHYSIGNKLKQLGL